MKKSKSPEKKPNRIPVIEGEWKGKKVKFRPDRIVVKLKVSVIPMGNQYYSQFKNNSTATSSLASQKLSQSKSPVQRLVFPEKLELSNPDAEILREVLSELRIIGFEIEEFSGNTFSINGTPINLINSSPVKIIENLIYYFKDLPDEADEDIVMLLRNKTARSMAKTLSVSYGKSLSEEEMSSIIDKLFQCQNPNYNPDGKIIIHIIEAESIEQKFK